MLKTDQVMFEMNKQNYNKNQMLAYSSTDNWPYDLFRFLIGQYSASGNETNENDKNTSLLMKNYKKMPRKYM